MKANIFAVLLTCLIANNSADENADLQNEFVQAHYACSAKTNFPPEGIKMLIGLDFAGASKVPNHECFEKCVFETVGFATPTFLNTDKIAKLGAINQPETIEQTQKSIAKCGPTYDPNNFDCDAAWKLYLCLQNAESILTTTTTTTTKSATTTKASTTTVPTTATPVTNPPSPNFDHIPCPLLRQIANRFISYFG